MELGLVKKIDIDQEMQQAYLDYAMSTIVARALPDARDGLKPVHRRSRRSDPRQCNRHNPNLGTKYNAHDPAFWVL